MDEPLDLSLPSVKLKNTNLNSSETDLPLDLSKKRIDNPQIIQTGPFTNSIIKNIPNFSNSKRSKINKGCGPSSISYINPPKPINAHSCISVRNTYSDSYEDGQESSEEPFDFSCRYSETKPLNNNGQKIGSNNNYKGKKSKSNNGNYSMYAETDLDQPTDYSLRYAENDSDSDSEVCNNKEKAATTEFVGDTVKTYCTEGTPYETPFNFSTSTSMSDLRISEKTTGEGMDIQDDKAKIQQDITGSDTNDKIPEEEIIVTDDQPQTPKMKTEFNSGLISPEKPMNYCEEGTPGYFSRVSSFGSLNSAAAGSGEEKLSEDKHKCENQQETPKSDKMQHKLPGSEVKMVKFENIVNYCEETPLMFSRSSSMGSIDSIEQSMHDDRSSVISDFSRLTSGIISPSEIPDSPTQTVPPSPKQRKSSDFGIISRPSGDKSLARRSLPTKSSIFEDDVTKFKEENTPAQFSVATSLSSLTIDDNDEPQLQVEPNQNSVNRSRTREQDKHTVDKDTETDGAAFHSTRENIQNRCFQVSGSAQFQPNFQDSKSSVYNPGMSSFSPRALPPSSADDNTTRVYNTEDTPAVLSRNGSISELSLSNLSILDEEPTTNRAYLSENSSQSSGGRKNNLDEKQLEASSSRQEMEEVWVRRESISKSNSNAYPGDLPPYLSSRDEFCQYAVEDSPVQFSLRSSLSCLTFDSETASGILECKTDPLTHQHSFSTETSQPPVQAEESSVVSVSEQTAEDSVDGVDNQEVRSISASSTPSVKNQETEKVVANSDETSSDAVINRVENINGPNEITKSFELKSDDSRCNSMKKRKWKWKWQFGSEDGHQSESSESTQTDKHSSNNEEFDQGRRSRVDKNNIGNLDASFKKKKWWKWKFGSKEKESFRAPQDITQDLVYDSVIDDQQNRISNFLEEEEPNPNELDTRSKSKRWKWKWKLNFKEEDRSKTEKSLLGMTKLKHQVSPEVTKEPIFLNDVSQSREFTKEMNSTIKLLSGLTLTDESSEKYLHEKYNIPVREKLDTPEPSDSEHSVIFEELDEQNSSAMNESNNKINGNDDGGKPANFAALVEECIQLGMPKKKNTPEKAASQNCSPELRTVLSEKTIESTKDQCNISQKIIAKNPRAAFKECIELERKISSSSNGYIGDNSDHSKSSYQQLGGRKTGEFTQDLSTRIGTTNFESNSLNRLSLGKERRKVFKSDDNMLKTNLGETAKRDIHSNLDRLVFNESYGPKEIIVLSKRESNKSKVSDPITEFSNINVTKQETLNSQPNRYVPETCFSKASQVIPKNVSVQSILTSKPESPSNLPRNTDFAAIIEECIQLGMPKRKESSDNTLSPTPSPYLVNQYVKRWPEYLSKISSENNKSASLPKSSSHHATARNYCGSNEDFTTACSQMKRDLVIHSALEKNINCEGITKKPNMPKELKEIEVKTGFDAIVPKKECNQFSSGTTQEEEDYEQSFYANVGATKSYLDLPVRKQSSPELKAKHESSPTRAFDAVKGNISPVVEDWVKLGIPARKLIEIRGSLDRRGSQDMLKSKDEVVEGNRMADSEDEAVYANTTERYMIFRNSLSPKGNASNEKAYSPILHDKKNSARSECSSEPQDFAAIIEECIQLGMPKNKGLSRETLNSNLSLCSTNSRSNSATRCTDNLQRIYSESNRSVTLPKGTTYFSKSKNYYSSNEDFSRNGSLRKNTFNGHNTADKNYGQDQSNLAKMDSDRTSPQISSRLVSTKNNTSPNTQVERVPQIIADMADCIEIKQEEEEPEESLYVNVSRHPGYSRCMTKQIPRSQYIRNTQRQYLERSLYPATMTDAKDDSEHPNMYKTDEEETTDKEKNGFDGTDWKCSSFYRDEICCGLVDDQVESEMSFASLADIDVKLLDPQIVLESLEKYTAKLISEAESRLSSQNANSSS
ncbi:adenomatous polyposis coli homolog isoform X2 [Harmonia axyridis]|uniref:adenomatous polyposis coli homolog isoform X2 n=1 Tax=Harmonia axyridis TaxID=115357 RepID=UPI001E276D53|nr:adenomatous polyposis coli homolog isoform X2 [Harmonia axyridis]